jgi:hypothetical protein
MAKVTGEAVKVSVTAIDSNDVNRWSSIEAEGKMMASENHNNWHNIYQGTALN